MLHLITVEGKSARDFYLEQHHTSDFKSLMRTVTSGRVMIVSTRFRSDLFYCAEKPEHDSILTLWALYTNTSISGRYKLDFITSDGDEESLSEYFQSINKLSTNWHHYRLYRKAFLYAFSIDQENPVAKTVLQCDQYLTKHPSIKRSPLTGSKVKVSFKHTQDPFSLAMRLINNETHSN